MKKTLMNVLRHIVKAIYALVKAKRYVVKRVKTHFIKSPKQSRNVSPVPISSDGEGRRYKPQSASRSRAESGATLRSAANSTRHRERKKALWKNKKIIAAACSFVVIIAIVLSVVLPGANNEAFAGAGPSDTRSTAPASQVPAYLSDDEMALLEYNDDTEGFSGEFTNDILKNTAGPGVSTMPTPDPTPIVTTGPTPIPTTEPVVEQLLEPGCHDTRMFEIQQRLMDLNYMESDEPTDFYGPITEYSLRLFQRKHDFKMNGTLDEETLSMLFSRDAKPYSVKLEDSGTDVETMQDRLKELGYFKAKSTGYFGPETEKAVKAFQKRNGLATDGSVGEQTREVLYSEDAKEAPKPAKPKPTAKPTKKPSNDSDDKPEKTPTPADPDKATASALIELAKSLKGSKYVRGGKGSTKFDCSGFVYYCLNQAGRKIGYMTSTGWKNCSLPKITKIGDLKPGDIIVFKTHHVGIYIGNGQMIDASSTNGKVVQRSCMTDHWKKEFACGRRVF